LKDPDKNVRKSAAEILGEAGPTVVEPLVAALREENVLVRSNAAWALGKIGDVSIVPHIIPLLKDSYPDARRITLWALGELKRLTQLPQLVMAEPSLTTEQRVTALSALINNPYDEVNQALRLSPMSIETFCQKMLRDRDELVRLHAQQILTALTLLRASDRDTATEPQTLLRPAREGSSQETQNLLRPVDAHSGESE
jgi:HEAT repeat protein